MYTGRKLGSKNLPKQAVEYLTKWMRDNIRSPYPTPEEKIQMADDISQILGGPIGYADDVKGGDGFSVSQLETRLINMRRTTGRRSQFVIIALGQGRVPLRAKAEIDKDRKFLSVTPDEWQGMDQDKYEMFGFPVLPCKPSPSKNAFGSSDGETSTSSNPVAVSRDVINGALNLVFLRRMVSSKRAQRLRQEGAHGVDTCQTARDLYRKILQEMPFNYKDAISPEKAEPCKDDLSDSEEDLSDRRYREDLSSCGEDPSDRRYRGDRSIFEKDPTICADAPSDVKCEKHSSADEEDPSTEAEDGTNEGDGTVEEDRSALQSCPTVYRSTRTRTRIVPYRKCMIHVCCSPKAPKKPTA